MEELAPSGRELEILKVLWELGRGSVRDVYRRMYPRLQPLYRSIRRITGYPST